MPYQIFRTEKMNKKNEILSFNFNKKILICQLTCKQKKEKFNIIPIKHTKSSWEIQTTINTTIIRNSATSSNYSFQFRPIFWLVVKTHIYSDSIPAEDGPRVPCVCHIYCVPMEQCHHCGTTTVTTRLKITKQKYNTILDSFWIDNDQLGK